MHETLRQEADVFLAQTYGFDPAVRADIVERATREIVADCRELLAVAPEGGTPAQRRAHRLKGHLVAVGLAALSDRARAIEALAGAGGGTALIDAVSALCRDILRQPSA